MNLKIGLFLMLCIIPTSFAQEIHIPSYFPIHDKGCWVYKDEFGNHDTATMKVDTSFLREINVEFSFSPNEKQFFRVDITGLRMLGLTIPLGTFMFDTPLGISSVNANIGDGTSTYNWEVTHVPTGIHKSWGTAQARLSRIETNLTVQDSTYDSVLVVSLIFGDGNAEYFLAKGRGIVMATATGSSLFSSRELVKFITPTYSSNARIWHTLTPNNEIRLISEYAGEMARFLYVANGNNIQAKIFNLKGQLIVKEKLQNVAVSKIRFNRILESGRYVLQLIDGSVCHNRSFSILP